MQNETIKAAVIAAVDRGEIELPKASAPKRGRPKGKPPEKVRRALELWNNQLSLADVCRHCQVNINTVRYWLYKQ